MASYKLIESSSNIITNLIILDNIGDFTVPSGYIIEEYEPEVFSSGSKTYTYFEYDRPLDDYTVETQISQSQVLTYTIYTSSISSQFVGFFNPTSSKFDTVFDNNIFDISGFLSSGSISSSFLLDINDIEFSNTKDLSPISNVNDFIDVDDKLIRQRREIKIITSSLIGYRLPAWVKELTIVSIGGGGSGGGGVKTLLSGSEDRHYYALGGAGGSGGNIAYTTFSNLNSNPNKTNSNSEGTLNSTETGSIYYIHSTIGKVTKGGTAYTGSNTSSYTDFTTHINSLTEELGNTMLRYIDSTNAIVGGNGENGGETLVIFQEISSLSGVTELGRIGASGGIGGKGGVAFKTLDFPTGSFEEFKELIEKTPFIAFTQPGASFNNENNIGETILIGGPGGHGLSFPVIT